MAGEVEFHPAALQEARAAVDWYSTRSRLAAVALVLELDVALAAIAEAPERWPTVGGGCRRYVLHRFPFLVIYREHGAAIEVVAVAHARRRPGYWTGRVNA